MKEGTETCVICKKNHHNSQGIHLKDAEPATAELLRKDHPEITDDTFICVSDLMKYKLKSIEQQLSNDSKQIEKTNEKIMQSIKDGQFITEQLGEEAKEPLTMGQKIADNVAKFGGSWSFILFFTFFIIVWMLINTAFLIREDKFDPYPFILLNLILSCLAALQAPVIMMSQNRQEERDRQQSKNDYHINLKSEIEIRLLHEKMDFFLTKQMRHLQDMQSMQIILLNDLHERMESLKSQINKGQKKLANSSSKPFGD